MVRSRDELQALLMAADEDDGFEDLPEEDELQDEFIDIDDDGSPDNLFDDPAAGNDEEDDD